MRYVWKLAAALVLALTGSAFAASPTFDSVIYKGASSGLITAQPQAAAGTWNWNWPTTAGSSGNPLLSGGGSSTAMTWGTTTGTGAFVQAASPTLTTPALGTPSALVLTNATGLPNTGLINTATTVNGQTCTLGSSCTITASAGTITVGTTAVASGTDTKVLFDNAGVLGEYTISGSGSVAMTTSPTFVTPALGTPSALVATNVSGTAASLTAGSVTTNANLTGDVTSSGNATTLAAGSASSLNSGTLAAARGGAGTITGALKGSGAGVVSQAACADLSNGATGCSTATGTSGATIPLLNGTNTWSGVQSVNSGDLALKGATSGTITLNAAATAGSNTITLPAGTTDFSATGGTGQLVKQAGAGAAFTVGTVACSGLSNGATGCSTATGTSGATIPLLNGTNVWSGQQSITPTTLAISTATFTPDGTSNNYAMTLVHASCPCTLANPSATPVAGTGGQIVVIQSSTGSDTIGTWGSQYESSGGTATLTLSTAANAVDILSYYVRDATHIELSLLTNFSH